MNVSILLLTVKFKLYLLLNDSMTESKKEEIEEIYFFEMNTKYISSSELKTSNSRVRSTSENLDVFKSRDV